MIALTRQERQTIVFLTAVSLISTGIEYAAKKIAPVRTVMENNRLLSLIDVNRADAQTLALIPGIGPKLAARIIEYREANQGIRGMDELSTIKGFSVALLKKLRTYAYVAGAP